MSDVGQGMAAFDATIEQQTGRSVAAWVRLVNEKGPTRHGEIVAWLKADHGLVHSHANQIAKRTLQSDASPEASVDQLFSGGKEKLRPLYDAIVAFAQSLGKDVEVAPKKVNVSLRRRKQFALVQPSTKTRLDVGLILKGVDAAGRLEPASSFNPMFTHRVRIETADQVDGQLKDWLRQAYLSAG